MGKVLACSYRTSKVNEKGQLERTVYDPGEEPKGLSKEEREQLEKDGLLVDDSLIDEQGNRLAPETVVRNLQLRTHSQSALEDAAAHHSNDNGDDKPKPGGAKTTEKK